MKNKLSVPLFSVLGVLVIVLLISGYPAGQKNALNNFVLTVPDVPQNLSFAGEVMPTKDFDVLERLDKELLVNTYWHSNTLLMLKRANKFLPVIEPILKKNGVPDDFKYLCMIESGLTNVVSPSNAAGFWQFLETTGKQYGLEINEEVDERYHLEKATEAACRYLKDSYARFGNWTLAAAAYNMGTSGVVNQLQSQGVKSYYDLYLNTETSRYVFRILAIKEIYQNQSKYQFNLFPEQYYPPAQTRTVTVDSTVNNWAEFALQNGTNYKFLKLHNPWLRKPFLKNKSRRSYEVRLPLGSIPVKGTVELADTLSIPEE